jgi:hypothetical protein
LPIFSAIGGGGVGWVAFAPTNRAIHPYSHIYFYKSVHVKNLTKLSLVMIYDDNGHRDFASSFISGRPIRKKRPKL